MGEVYPRKKIREHTDESPSSSRTQTCESLGFHVTLGQFLFFIGVSELSLRLYKSLGPNDSISTPLCFRVLVKFGSMASLVGWDTVLVRLNLILDKPLSFKAKVYTPSLGQSS